MVRVKICGIRDEAAAAAAAAAGADAVGFVFASSRRQVDVAQARRIAATLPPFVARVGVFVDDALDRVRAAADAVPLDAVQLHGDETPEDCEALQTAGVRVIKALRLRGPLPAAEAARWPAVAVLLDSYRPDAYGGTGVPFDWRWAAEAAGRVRIILSGGLTPETVGQAIAAVRPYSVDVSSGVETGGRKDPGKIRAFVAAVRAAATALREVR